MISKHSLEKTYGIHISCTPYYSVLKEKFMSEYTIYTADGCRWGGFSTMKEVVEECRRYSKTFLELKKKAGK